MRGRSCFNMADYDAIETLERQLAKCEAAITEFSAIDAQLREQRLNPRVADMIRVNRDTINTMERSMALMRLRLVTARNALDAKSGSTAPFKSTSSTQ
jgi:hypothetical protein